MARNRVLLPVLGGLVVVGVAILLLLRGGDGGAADGSVAVLKDDAASHAADGPAMPTAPAPAASPAALPASLAPVVAKVTDPHALPESYRRALGTLTGRVLEPAGTPVAGMTIELIGGRKSMVALPHDALLDPAGLDFNPIVGKAVTASDGRFRLTDLEPRTLGALVLDPGGPRALLRLLDVSPVSGQEKDLGDITLPATATLKGVVVDERGAGIAGVRVRATELPMAGIPGMESVIGAVADFRDGGAVLVPSGTKGLDHDVVFAPPSSITRLEQHLPIPTTTTDGSGAFVLNGVMPGLVLFAADDGVHLPLVKEGVPTGAAGAERDMGKLVMGDGVTLHGRVVNDRNEPVAGAELLAGNTLGIVPAAVLKGPVRSGPDGRFVVKGLHDGLVWAAARTDRRREYSAFSTDDLSREVTFTMPAPRALRVTVLDDKGTPLSGARFFGRQVEDKEAPDFLVPPRPLDDQVTASTENPGLYVFADMQPGKWELAATVPGYDTERTDADLSGGDASVEVRLVAGRALVVKVVRAADHHTPVEHAFVAAFQGDEESPDTGARTDADGIARLTGLRSGEINLQVTHPALAITEQKASVPGPEQADVQQVVVELESGCTILGSVVENGGPPAEPVMVMLQPHDAVGDGELPRATISDPDGNFRFELVEPGSVQLEARSRNDLQNGLSLFESFFNSPLAQTKVEVPVTGEVHATLVVGAELAETDTGWLAGTLTVNGRAAEGWKVRTFGQIRRTASVDAAGRFDLGRIASGEVTVSASAPGSSLMDGASQSSQVTLAKGEHKLVSLAFSTGGLRGLITSAADGRALGGVKVRAVAEGKGNDWFRQASAVTTPDGHFEIDTIAAGTYRLTARADGFANTSGAPFTVSELQVVSGLELHLAKALHADGTLSVSGVAQKPSWMWLVATSSDGTTRDTAKVDRKTGAFSFDGLAPGSWSLSLATDLDAEMAPITMSFDRDVSGLKLTFEPAPEAPAQDGQPAQTTALKVEIK